MSPSRARTPGDDPAAPDRVVRDGVAVPTRRVSLWLAVGVATALMAVWYAPSGIVGMVAGSGAHLKGSRWGLPVAGFAAVTTVIGMALVFFVRLQ